MIGSKRKRKIQRQRKRQREASEIEGERALEFENGRVKGSDECHLSWRLFASDRKCPVHRNLCRLYY